MKPVKKLLQKVKVVVIIVGICFVNLVFICLIQDSFLPTPEFIMTAYNPVHKTVTGKIENMQYHFPWRVQRPKLLRLRTAQDCNFETYQVVYEK